MTTPIRILAFAGSARVASLNKRLARAAADTARSLDLAVTLIDLRDYPLPLYDGDLEDHEGLPEAAHALRALFFRHDALLIASPEYNGFFPPLLKNALDWISRRQDGEEPRAAYVGKIAGLLAATRGGSGGGRGLQQLREQLLHLRVDVVEAQVTVAQGETAFGDDGALRDPVARDAMRTLISDMAERARAIPGAALQTA